MIPTFLQSLKAQDAALSDSEDKDDMDIADGGGKTWPQTSVSFKDYH